MSLRSTLLKAAGIYVLGRLATNISGDDIAKVTGLTADDLRRYGIDRADAVLEAIGLRRRSSVPSSTGLVLAGFAAGAVAAAGVMFLFYSTQGSEVRRKIVEYFSKGDEDASNGAKDTTSAPMAS